MEKIRITGMGLVNRAGITAEAFWEQLCLGAPPAEILPETDFKPDVPPAKLRRMNRYCKMALYAAKEAWKDGTPLDETDVFSRGTIFTTGYGSMVSHIKFCREVAKGEPDFCSPTVFTGIVPNSCVGTVCMFLKCKGVSTVLCGGNQLEYSALLLEDKRAEVILSGAVEEYCEESFQALEGCEAAKGAELAEGCAVLCLENREDGKGYCTLVRSSTTGIPAFPLLCQAEPQESVLQMRELLSEYVEEEPDLVFTCANGTYFDELEREALQNVFPGGTLVNSIKRVTGETVGCGFTMNMAAASMCLGHGYVPGALAGGEDRPVKKILATGFDTAGNYMCALLEK